MSWCFDVRCDQAKCLYLAIGDWVVEDDERSLDANDVPVDVRVDIMTRRLKPHSESRHCLMQVILGKIL